MRGRSVATRQLDPYRAGLELGKGLRELAPEVVFLFSSIHYDGSGELLEGLHDALDAVPILIGATGDGFYEAVTVGEIGAAALGLHSDGRVRWRLASASGVSQDVEGTLDRCIADLTVAADGAEPALCVVFADFRADAATLVEALGARLSAPTVGGLAGDEYHLERCFVYAGREVLTDGLAVLAAVGDLGYAIHMTGDLMPVGRPGVVTAAAGTALLSIDGMPATEFITQQAGKPLSLADLGISAFRLTGAAEPASSCLRTVRAIDPGRGSVTLFGAVQPGQHIQFCQVVPEAIVQDVRDLSRRLSRTDRSPAAGLVISCAGRKRVLTHRQDDHEVGAVREGYGRVLPLVGFPSFGEIGPRPTETGYGRTLFHNMTCILLVFET
jgi:hypothetical protein